MQQLQKKRIGSLRVLDSPQESIGTSTWCEFADGALVKASVYCL